MRRFAIGLVLVVFGLGLGACDDEHSAVAPRDAGEPDQPADAGSSDREISAVGACLEEGRDSSVWIASAKLGAAPLRFDRGVELRGDAAAALFESQQGVTNGLRFPADRPFLLRDRGFWDIDLESSARWYDTPTLLVLGVRAGDVDGDGDEDVMLLSTVTDPAGIATRLAVWERTPDGLTERAEVVRVPGLILPLPYMFSDLDGDGDLDILAYEDLTPIAYVHDGSFGFTRSVRGEPEAEFEGKISGLFDASDRNGDGRDDLLVGAGQALEINLFVLLQDEAGNFSRSGPTAQETAPLAPHGPLASGSGVADVTRDGRSDWVSQDPEVTVPRLRLHASVGASELAPLQYLDGLGFEFADVDEDGNLDILTTRDGRLHALLARGDGEFEPRDLGLDLASPEVMDFAADPGSGAKPARLYVQYNLPCRACDADCSGRCVLGSCVEPSD